MNLDSTFFVWALVCINLAATAMFATAEAWTLWQERRTHRRKPISLDDWIERMDREDGGEFLPQAAGSCRDDGRAA